MIIELEDGRKLGVDLAVKVTMRYDLTPIPSTVEAVIRANEAVYAAIKNGAIIKVGSDGDRYRVLKVKMVSDSGMVGRSEAIQAMQITAMLEDCFPLAYMRQRAIIKEKTTFGEVYLACGCTAKVKDDIQVERFSCFVGGVGTYGVALSMQEAAAVPIWRDSALTFMRVKEAMKQAPVASVPLDLTTEIESEFIERHEIPAFLSVDEGGGFVYGKRDSVRRVAYTPRKSESTLRNMSTALVNRRIYNGQLDASIRAGDVFKVGGQAHIVVTAVHSRSGGDGAPAESSRFWLATLEG